MTLLTPELSAMIGRKAHYPAREAISDAMIRYFALATGDANPIYCDTEAAQAAGYPARVAPPTFVVEMGSYGHAPPRPTGFFLHDWDLPVEGFAQIRGGNSYSFKRPIYGHDAISVTYELLDIEEKNGKAGAMLLVTSRATYHDAKGQEVAQNLERLFLKPKGGAQ